MVGWKRGGGGGVRSGRRLGAGDRGGLIYLHFSMLGKFTPTALSFWAEYLKVTEDGEDLLGLVSNKCTGFCK